jgi:hypothetical protein
MQMIMAIEVCWSVTGAVLHFALLFTNNIFLPALRSAWEYVVVGLSCTTSVRVTAWDEHLHQQFSRWVLRKTVYTIGEAWRKKFIQRKFVFATI